MLRLFMDVGRYARVLFWILVLGQILPLWVFALIPTQDGPSHLANARILQRCLEEAEPHAKYFEIRAEPLPNWTTEAILWLLLWIVPAWMAEKILLTGYVIAFSWTYRRLALALRPESVVIPLLGILFCYCRCFWCGFYNYCLSLALLFGVLAFLTQQKRLTWIHVLLLAYLGVLSYFTHLLGFLLTAAASLTAILFWYESRGANLGRAVLAWIPSGVLAGWYFSHMEVAREPVVQQWLPSTMDWVFSNRCLDVFEQEASALGRQIFGPLVLEIFPVGWCLLGFLLVLFYITLASVFLTKKQPGQFSAWPMLILLVLVSLAYFVGPEHITMQQGGYFKQRFAVLMPLFLGLLFREPVLPSLRLGLVALFVGIYGMHTANVWQYFASQNRDLREYTAGLEALGSGRTLFVAQPDTTKRSTSDPLMHAADYYCADTENVNLDNYEAVTGHFPVRFVRGHLRGTGPFAFYPRRDIVDAILIWDRSDSSQQALRDFTLAFSEGRLKIYLRNPP